MNDEIRKIITDQINRHVAMTQDHRAWLANDIATRVEKEVARLLKIEKEELENRGAIQAHINRCELPFDIPSTDNQAEMVGHIVDAYHLVKEQHANMVALAKR